MAIHPQRDEQKNPIRDKWLIRGIWVNGKERLERFSGTKEAAQLREAELRLQYGAVGKGTQAAPPFSSFSIGQYAQWAERNLAETTWRNRKSQLAILVEFFRHTPLDQITSAMVEEFQKMRSAEGIGPVKINDDTKVLVAMLNYAKHLKLIREVPSVKRLKEVKRKGRVMVWSDAQVLKLYEGFQEMSPWLLGQTVTMINTGVRKGESLAIRKQDVLLERRLILIWPNEEWRPKNNEPREVPISDVVIPFLKRAMLVCAQPEERIFRGRSGRALKTWPTKHWDAARHWAGVGGSPHVCRHTYASHFLANATDVGDPMFLLAKVLGHSRERVTELYAHLLPDHLQRAVNVVNIGPGVAPPLPESMTSLLGSPIGFRSGSVRQERQIVPKTARRA